MATECLLKLSIHCVNNVIIFQNSHNQTKTDISVTKTENFPMENGHKHIIYNGRYIWTMHSNNIFSFRIFNEYRLKYRFANRREYGYECYFIHGTSD